MFNGLIWFLSRLVKYFLFKKVHSKNDERVRFLQQTLIFLSSTRKIERINNGIMFRMILRNLIKINNVFLYSLHFIN